MKTITLYNSLGQTQGVMSSNDPDAFKDGHGDLMAIEGSYNSNYYIANGQAVAKDPQPSENHVFDYTTKTWQPDLSKASELTRQQRNQLLTQIDRVNPVWYATLTVDQQQTLAAYRQQLLDVPQQAGFPIDVTWPAKPTWL